MNICIIGTGHLASAIARQALSADHSVALVGRTPERAQQVATELGSGVTAAEPADLKAADLIFLAVPWPNVAQAVADLPATEGILVDATNPFVELEPELVFDDLGDRGASEIVAELVPQMRFVKAFNTVRAECFEDGSQPAGTRRVMLISGDDPEAKGAVRAFVESLGFVCIDLGDLVTGGRLQQAGGPLGSGEDLLVSGEPL